MEIGINDDDFDSFDDENTLTQDIDHLDDDFEQESQQESSEKFSDSDVIDELLKNKGILDSSKIKFENEEGEIEEIDFKNLSLEEKLNILNSKDEFNQSNNYDLDNSEIQLINIIRKGNMTPQEYINFIQRDSIERYINNNQIQFQIDELDDDQLYALDILARMGEDNVSDEELKDIIDQAKQNPDLYKKQVTAIRQEYQDRELQTRQQEMQFRQNQEIERFNQFASVIEDEIRNFTEFGGYELNMDEDEMEELYEFITGKDGAGVSIFGKALNDPRLLVRMAWFALNGDQAIQDINDYWTQVVKDSRKPKAKDNKVAIRSNQKKSNFVADFDDEDF